MVCMKWSKDFISCENFCDKKSQYLDELEYNLIVWRWGRNFSEIIDGCILWYELNWWEEATLERGPQWWPWWWPYSVPCILLPFTLSFSSSSSSSLIWPCLCDGGKPSWCISPSFQVLSKESNRENPFPADQEPRILRRRRPLHLDPQSLLSFGVGGWKWQSLKNHSWNLWNVL